MRPGVLELAIVAVIIVGIVALVGWLCRRGRKS